MYKKLSSLPLMLAMLIMLLPSCTEESVLLPEVENNEKEAITESNNTKAATYARKATEIATYYYDSDVYIVGKKNYYGGYIYKLVNNTWRGQWHMGRVKEIAVDHVGTLWAIRNSWCGLYYWNGSRWINSGAGEGVNTFAVNVRYFSIADTHPVIDQGDPSYLYHFTENQWKVYHPIGYAQSLAQLASIEEYLVYAIWDDNYPLVMESQGGVWDPVGYLTANDITIDPDGKLYAVDKGLGCAGWISYTEPEGPNSDNWTPYIPSSGPELAAIRVALTPNTVWIIEYDQYNPSDYNHVYKSVGGGPWILVP